MTVPIRLLTDEGIEDALALADRIVASYKAANRSPVLPRHLEAERVLLREERALRVIGVDPSMT